MLILCDHKMPVMAMQNLAAYGEVIHFATNGITYEGISGHPDIFFCKTPGGLIVAPNLPEKFFNTLNQSSLAYTKGSLPVGKTYPASARYNSLISEKYIIQNPAIADAVIAELNPGRKTISVNQGYVQCNLLALPDNRFITSDRGIEKTLKQHHLEVLFVDPSAVKLEGFKHGFFGGACGMLHDKIFICGAMSYFKEKKLIFNFADRAGINIVELYDGPPVDVGTILFLPCE